MKRRRDHRAYLIDIEGVLVRDKRYEPVPGVVDWINGLVRCGTPFCLVSNNTTHRPEDLIADLVAAGYNLHLEHLVGALGLGVQWLRQRERRNIMWLGTPTLADFWAKEGFELIDEGPCDAIVLGVNPELEPGDLDRVLPALLDDNADLVCLHRNSFYLDALGQRRLGPGAWAAALEALGGGGQGVTIGKPSTAIYEEALKRVGVPAEEALFISDDPISDLVTAGQLGMGTVFVLSGKYPDHEVLGRLDQEQWPDIICSSCSDLDEEGDH